MQSVCAWCSLPGLLLGTFLGFMTTQGSAQITRTRPIDVLKGLGEGTINVTVDPPLSKGPIENVFDANRFTDAGVQDRDTLLITLRFDTTVQISKVRVFSWHSGDWTLESANSEDDLNNRSGSYNLLVGNKSFEAFQWDSAAVNFDGVGFLRLTARNVQDHYVYLGEWELGESITLTSLLILPHPPRVLPGTSLQLYVKVLDNKGNVYPYDLIELIDWVSSDPAVARVNSSGRLTGVALGTCTLTASTEMGTLFGSATASVEPDFESPKASTRTVKVALVLQDAMTSNGQKLHVRFGWANPNTLVEYLLDEFNWISGGVVKFQIVETHDDDTLFTVMDGSFLTVDQLVGYYNTPGWTPLVRAAQEGRLQFDYKAMLEYYDLCTKRNNGEIDEIWVYSHPYAAMYESRLAGPNAFWYNSPPLTDTDCTKLLSIMGWNYERGIPEALESFGHRTESTMWQAYGRWDTYAPNPNNWEVFTRIDKDHPGGAHVGNIHYPPNGRSDYDHTNSAYVTTYADNWKRYPYLLDQTRTINCQDWGCTYLGYMRWWYSHLPRYVGVTEGVLNNWWHYVVDYEEAVELARTTPIVGIQDDDSNPLPEDYSLEQNYPNPFNPSTKIRFDLPAGQAGVGGLGVVSLRVYDVLGREVATLVNEELEPGSYEVTWDAAALASGVYFYRIQAGNFVETKKLIRLK